MPTLNPRLKIATSYGQDLPRCGHEEEGRSGLSSDAAAAGGARIPTHAFTKNMRYDNHPTHPENELHIHIVNNPVQRNASDTSLLRSFGEDGGGCGLPPEANNVQLINRFSSPPIWVADPSLVSGNIRNTRVKSASVRMTQGNRREKVDCFHVAKMKPRRRVDISSKQQTEGQTERIHSTVPEIHITKSRNLVSKTIQNTKLYSLNTNVESQKHRKILPLRGKLNSDLSINVAPYSQKSSAAKDHLLPYRSNSSSARGKNFKRAANSLEGVVMKKAPLDDQQPKNVNLKRNPAGSHDVTLVPQLTSKQDKRSSRESKPQLADNQPGVSKHQRSRTQVTIPPGRERTHSEGDKEVEQLSKIMRHELKRKQRREIYALNKVMTELEHERFILFMQDIDSGAGGV